MSTFEEALWAPQGQVLWKWKSTSQTAVVVTATRMHTPGIENWHSPFGTEQGTEMFAPLTQSASARQRSQGESSDWRQKATCLKMYVASNYNAPNCEPRPSV